MHPDELLKRFLFALCIWREARGETYAGMLAVGSVIKNRVNDRRWPNYYTDVILQRYQFSCFNKSDPQVSLYPKSHDDLSWAECYNAAIQVLDNEADHAEGANHYFAKSMKTKPSWAVGQAPVATIGNHIFYKL